MNHQQFVDAMQQSADDPPTVVFIELPDGTCRWQALFDDANEARLEILIGNACKCAPSTRKFLSDAAIEKLIEFGYQRDPKLPRNLYRYAHGTPSLIAAGAWDSVEALFKYIFCIPIERLSVRAEKMDWDW